MPKKKKKNKKLRLLVKLSLCFVYSIIITILVISAFRLYEKDKAIYKWKDVTSTEEYAYINVSQMSEAFAIIPDENKQIHFVIEQNPSGEWYTYLVAIKQEDYNKYKNIIDYTYERTTEKKSEVKIYGYPRKIPKEVKSLAIKNIKNFVPIENQVVLTNDNFEEYLTNTYLDTTIVNTHKTNYIVVTLLMMAFIVLVLVIFTILDKDKIVDEVDEIIEKEIEKENKNKKKDEENKKKKTTKKKSSSGNKNVEDKKVPSGNKKTTEKKSSSNKEKVSKNSSTENRKTTTKKTESKENKSKKEEEIEIL